MKSNVEENCVVRMSLLDITEETDNCDPMEGLEGGREGSIRKKGEEAQEGALEEWKRSGREARVCYPGMGVSKLAGEEMMEGMARVRRNRLGRGISIMNEVSVVEQRKGKKHCCVCQ